MTLNSKYLAAILAWFLLGGAAHAGWEALRVGMPREPVLKLVPSAGRLLVLQSRHLIEVSPEVPSTRRLFTLTSPTDAFVDLLAEGDRLWLAGRRAVWESHDGGITWRQLDSLPPRDPNEWLALGRTPEGLLLGASGYGLKRIEAGLSTSWGALGHAPIDAAWSDQGRLLMATRGTLVAITDGTGPRRQPLSDSGQIDGFWKDEGALWIAGSSTLWRCQVECLPAGPGRTQSLARGAGGYWAATTSDVWHRGNDEMEWRPANAGMPAGGSMRLAVLGSQVWMASSQGLHVWAASAMAAASAVPIVVGEPSIAQVRNMVVVAQKLAPAEAESWRRRARWKAAAPSVTLSLRRGLDERTGRTLGNTIGISTTENRILLGPDGQSITRASGRATDYGVSLNWSLDEMVFNSGELSVNNEMEDQFRLRESVVMDVTRLFYDRRRAMAEKNHSRDERRREDLSFRIAELTAELDFYTGGRFSESFQDAAARNEMAP